MTDKKSFVLYTDWTPYFRDLSVEESGILIQAIFAWANDEEYEIKTPILKTIFDTIKMRLEEDNKNYQDMCKKRKEYGSKGGRPKKEKDEENLKKHKVSKKTKRLSEKPKAFFEKHNDNDNDNDNDNECSNEHISSSKAALSVRARARESVFPDDAELNQAFLDYAEMRKVIKTPLTDRAVVLEVKKLEQLAPGDRDKQIAILEQSTTHCWRGLYPLKPDGDDEDDWLREWVKQGDD